MDEHIERLREAAREGGNLRALEGGESPTLLVAVHASRPEPMRALEEAFEALRHASSREQVRTLGRDQGYRIEDLETVVLGIPAAVEHAPLEAWLRRRLTKTTVLETVASATEQVTLACAFLSRSGASPVRPHYARGPDGRVRVEAFELHIAEHCNLRCANCCNMSPHVARHLLSAAEVERICAELSPSLVADVVKIMGGEPLLHPDLPAVLRVLRRAGIGDRVRLFTNGLRLPAMSEAFWQELEDLTISNYSSAPVKPAILELAREKSRQYGFVLNIKPVTEFSRVLSPRYEPDDEVTQRTFTRCWLRHRCLIVRRGRFYMCTRSAYANEFLSNVAHEPVPEGVTLDRSGDGIPVDAPELAARLEQYLNRHQPLGACRYCLGGEGPTEPHHQLTREEVRQGRLSAASRVAEP